MAHREAGIIGGTKDRILNVNNTMRLYAVVAVVPIGTAFAFPQTRPDGRKAPGHAKLASTDLETRGRLESQHPQVFGLSFRRPMLTRTEDMTTTAKQQEMRAAIKRIAEVLRLRLAQRGRHSPQLRRAVCSLLGEFGFDLIAELGGASTQAWRGVSMSQVRL